MRFSPVSAAELCYRVGMLLLCVELRESISRSWHGAYPAAVVTFGLVLISSWYLLRWASGRRKYTTPLKKTPLKNLGGVLALQCCGEPQNRGV